MSFEILFILLEIVLFDKGISLNFTEHLPSITALHMSIAAGKIKFFAIGGLFCFKSLLASLNKMLSLIFLLTPNFLKLFSTLNIFFKKRLVLSR